MIINRFVKILTLLFIIIPGVSYLLGLMVMLFFLDENLTWNSVAIFTVYASSYTATGYLIYFNKVKNVQALLFPFVFYFEIGTFRLYKERVFQWLLKFTNDGFELVFFSTIDTKLRVTLGDVDFSNYIIGLDLWIFLLIILLAYRRVDI